MKQNILYPPLTDVILSSRETNNQTLLKFQEQGIIIPYPVLADSKFCLKIDLAMAKASLPNITV